jgi:hypothetical protein
MRRISRHPVNSRPGPTRQSRAPMGCWMAAVMAVGAQTVADTTFLQPPSCGGMGNLIHVLPDPCLNLSPRQTLRDRLLGELNDLAGTDAAALWAHRCLPQKNRLTAADARRVEEALQGRLASFQLTAPSVEPQPGKEAELPLAHHGLGRIEPRKRPRAKVIDKAALTLPEPRRVRDRDHVRHVAKQPCPVCGRSPSDTHHLRFAQSRALGRKVSDEFVVPLCRGHHREVHRHGDERAWWRAGGIDPTAAARALWRETHPLSTAPTAADSTESNKDRATSALNAEQTAENQRARKIRLRVQPPAASVSAKTDSCDRRHSTRLGCW